LLASRPRARSFSSRHFETALAILFLTALIAFAATSGYASAQALRSTPPTGDVRTQAPARPENLRQATSPEVREAIARVLSARRDGGNSAGYTARLRAATREMTDALAVLGTVDDPTSVQRARAKLDSSLVEVRSSYTGLMGLRGSASKSRFDGDEPLSRLSRDLDSIRGAASAKERKAAALALRDRLQAHDLPKSSPAPVTQRLSDEEDIQDRRRAAAKLTK
jgi:hypothetical protein